MFLLAVVNIKKDKEIHKMAVPGSARSMRLLAARNLRIRPAVVPRRLHLSALVSNPVARVNCLASPGQQAVRPFSLSSARNKGLSPDSEEPAPKEAEPMQEHTEPTPLEEDEYHERAEQYLQEIVSRVEEVQESKGEVEVDYSVSFPLALLW